MFDDLGEIDLCDDKYQDKPGAAGRLSDKEKECK
jgi:hypothetical protein